MIGTIVRRVFVEPWPFWAGGVIIGLLGAALFGVGWGMSGTCPGTVLAQTGEGRVFGLFTFFGMIGGTYIYALLTEKHPEL